MTDQRMDATLVKKAVKSLFAYEGKKAQENSSAKLLNDYAKPILVQIQLCKAIGAPVVRPVRVKIPHTMFSPSGEDHTICLFCRTEDKAEINEHLENQPIEGLTTVVSMTDVKKLYSRIKERKKLLGDHTHFICDARVMNQLYNLLGNVFSTRNNYPVPVDFKTVSKLEGAVAKSVDSTYMHLKGQNITIRFGHNAMSPVEVSTNVLQGMAFAVAKLKDQWKSVHSVHIKTSDSAALPVYSKVPSDTLKYVQELAAKKEKQSTKIAKGEKGEKGAKGAKAKESTKTTKGKAAVPAKAAKKDQAKAPEPEQQQQQEEEEEEEEEVGPSRRSRRAAPTRTTTSSAKKGAKPATKQGKTAAAAAATSSRPKRSRK